MLFELSSADIDLRGEVIATPLTERGDPVIEASLIPLPDEPEEEAIEAEQEEEQQTPESA